MTLRLFDHDRSAALSLSTLRREERAGVEVSEIRYANGAGGEAAAFLVAPGEGWRSAVVLAHGGTEGGKHLFLDEAVELAGRGIAALLADASFPPLGDAAADERAIVAAVLVQRRGLDVLTSLGATRLGYFGHSAGGTQGAILSAVEPRLNAIVIAATGSGIVRWAREQGFSERDYLDALARFDPARFVGVPGPRHLLFQHGHQDETIHPGEARAMFAAAAEPKVWAEYDCGHGVDGHAPAREDRLSFFFEQLAWS